MAVRGGTVGGGGSVAEDARARESEAGAALALDGELAAELSGERSHQLQPERRRAGGVDLTYFPRVLGWFNP